MNNDKFRRHAIVFPLVVNYPISGTMNYISGRVDEDMQQTLVKEMDQFIEEMRGKERAKIYTVPIQVINRVKRKAHLEILLKDILKVATGQGGIEIAGMLRKEFGLSFELTENIRQWSRDSKDQLEAELHEAINRAVIRFKQRNLFFHQPVDDQEVAEALRLLKKIAHAAIHIQFHSENNVEAQVEILDSVLKYFALRNTYSGDMIDYRNLISSDRLYAVSSKNEVSTALKAHAKKWYQHSGLTFLMTRDGYHTYEYVKSYLYLLTGEQLEKLRQDFVKYIFDDFQTVKLETDLNRAEYLRKMLETVLSWRIEEIDTQ